MLILLSPARENPFARPPARSRARASKRATRIRLFAFVEHGTEGESEDRREKESERERAVEENGTAYEPNREDAELGLRKKRAPRTESTQSPRVFTSQQK